MIKKTKLTDVCQVCKHHNNKPSYCKKEEKFVKRKQSKCDFFKQK
jgi:hypothetical protein